MMGRAYFRLRSPAVRLQSIAFWDMFIFLLNGFVFILIGLQLPEVLDGISGISWQKLVLYATIVSLTVILVRIAWVFLTSDMRLARGRRPLSCVQRADWRELMVIAWAGMRGVVSLAAALALKSDVPGRDLIIFLTFSVILVTLVAQGLTLAPLIQALGIAGDDIEAREELEARNATVRAARARLDELANEDWAVEEAVRDVALHVENRAVRLNARRDGEDADESAEELAVVFARLRRELLDAEMAEAIKLRNDGRINDQTLRTLQRELDLEWLRLEQT